MISTFYEITSAEVFEAVRAYLNTQYQIAITSNAKIAFDDEDGDLCEVTKLRIEDERSKTSPTLFSR